MIRRGFWLAAGAVIGVAGYRKATRLARTLTGQPAMPRLTPGSGASATPWPVRVGAGARSTAAFVHDVRAGMAEYRADHGEADPVGLHGEHGGLDPARYDEAEPAGLLAEHGGPDPAGDRVRRGTPGPANGRALHGEQIGRSLGSRSPENLGGRAQPGAHRRGRREH